MAGAMAGAVMAFANCPIELLKVRLQIQDPSQPRLYSSIFDCAIQTAKREGIRGLYRGFFPTLLRDIPSFAVYFWVYESCKRINDSHSGGVLQSLLAGGLAGIIAWIPCYPQDVIKSRMQTSKIHRNALECARHLLREFGFWGFLRGFGPTIARAFPANAATFFVYEFVHSSLQK